VNLGDRFSNIDVDLTINKYDRVKVYSRNDPNKIIFHTKLDYLSKQILSEISKKLQNRTDDANILKISNSVRSIINQN
jgi:hypothetical protein